MTIEEKYSDSYFEHWVAMLNFSDGFNLSEVEDQIDFYKNVEGENNYNKLKEELSTIIKNNDLALFIKLSDETGTQNMTLQNLEKMADLMLESTIS